MEVKIDDKKQEITEKKVIKDVPKEETKPVSEQPIKKIQCSLISGEVNYII
jgi:hypothetical protein